MGIDNISTFQTAVAEADTLPGLESDDRVFKLNIGCGYNQEIPGWVGIDLIDGPGVDICAPADELPFVDSTVQEIMAEHLIEHLTFYEFNRTMAEWYRVLKPGGKLTIECPDLLGLCRQFIESNEYSQYTSYKGQWPLIAHLYGHQRGKNEAEIFSQVHKSGYTKIHLTNILLGLGYGNIISVEPRKATPHSPVLRLEAIKI
jgi:predicted SAM-dependent methyltransferase